ncbi:MAG: TetR/AcrR family macrolide resistance operon transcriptional repressor [Halieaceae bacterium]|jgi:TetR/AcrR family macrolide resistance operon transcriptional repressor
MARPKSASDTDILQAAHRVFALRGPDGFSLAEVAREVKISRAAIIQRYGSTRSLMLTLTQQMVIGFRNLMDGLPVSRSGDALISLAQLIGRMAGSREQLALFQQNLHADLRDDDLTRFEGERSTIWFGAISKRMPETSIPHDTAVALFAAQIGGNLMQLHLQLDAVSASQFLVERTRAWLSLTAIAFSDTIDEYPLSLAMLEPGSGAASDPMPSPATG